MEGDPHTAWGGKEGPMKRQYQADYLRSRRVPHRKCTNRMWVGLRCPAVATDVGLERPNIWG